MNIEVLETTQVIDPKLIKLNDTDEPYFQYTEESNILGMLQNTEVVESSEQEYYKSILAQGPPEGKIWHPSYKEHLKRCTYIPYLSECYDWPIYVESFYNHGDICVDEVGMCHISMTPELVQRIGDFKKYRINQNS